MTPSTRRRPLPLRRLEKSPSATARSPALIPSQMPNFAISWPSWQHIAITANRSVCIYTPRPTPPRIGEVTVNSIPAATPARTHVAWLIWTVGVARLHPDRHAADHARRCGPFHAADRFGLSPAPWPAVSSHPGGGVLPPADSGGTASWTVRAAGDARGQRCTTGLRTDPAGASTTMPVRRGGRVLVGTGDAFVFAATLALIPRWFSPRRSVDDPADNNRRPTRVRFCLRSVRRVAPPQRMVDRVHQRRRSQARADGRAGIRRRAKWSARSLGSDAHRLVRDSALTERGVVTSRRHGWDSSAIWPRSSR